MNEELARVGRDQTSVYVLFIEHTLHRECFDVVGQILAVKLPHFCGVLENVNLVTFRFVVDVRKTTCIREMAYGKIARENSNNNRRRPRNNLYNLF